MLSLVGGSSFLFWDKGHCCECYRGLLFILDSVQIMKDKEGKMS